MISRPHLPLPFAGLFLPLLIWLAMLVWGGPAFMPDHQVYLALYGLADAGAARLVTALGGWEILVSASFTGALYLSWKRRKGDALLLLSITLGARLLVFLQKLLVDHPRPDLQDHLVVVSSASFPSGHAANAMATWLALALILPQKRRAAPVALAIAAALLIGLSRIVLGVHWPSDVLGGWSFGFAWTLGLIIWLRGKPNPS